MIMHVGHPCKLIPSNYTQSRHCIPRVRKVQTLPLLPHCVLHPFLKGTTLRKKKFSHFSPHLFALLLRLHIKVQVSDGCGVLFVALLISTESPS